MPLITYITPNSLCHHPIQDQCPNLTLRDIVRRLYQQRLINKKKALFLFRVGGLLFQKDCAANYLFYPNTENKLTFLYIFVSFLVISP